MHNNNNNNNSREHALKAIERLKVGNTFRITLAPEKSESGTEQGR